MAQPAFRMIEVPMLCDDAEEAGSSRQQQPAMAAEPRSSDLPEVA